ncbi:OmpA family protein [Algibacter sp. L4_22]|uniref:OmpA family protein n=1 Tax=Algibacter sp. L4_22 TaxID=2942477 RepID=UPI00201B5A78|nr:OmpA family protein [Algibacter sp. L4_22]MCL5127201.1 OmpA family protein [Algibacter sp. L4_22]
MHKLVLSILSILTIGITFSQSELSHDVYFDTDKFDVPSTEKNRLLLFISTLSDIEIESISIYGFCDDVGADTYNLKLSQDRADAIKIIFSDNEISEDLITNVDGKGEILLKIIEENNLLNIRGLNRKVEINVKPKPPVIEEVVVEEIIEVVEPPKPKNAPEKLQGKLKVGDKIILENILFKTGYSTILSSSKKTLDTLAEILVARKNLYFTIQGHVCCTQLTRDAVDRKTKQRNLSETRAKFVYDYFVKKGVNKRRMRYMGMRRKFPLGGDPKLDRRVEVLVTYVGDSN